MKPFLYRWIFKPSDGTVTLAHDHEDHPAYTRYHGDLADEAWEPNTFYGNAFRIKGGWRILDGDHKPVNDPLIVKSVLQAIKDQEAEPAELEGESDWSEPVLASDFEKTHYGLPMRELG